MNNLPKVSFPGGSSCKMSLRIFGPKVSLFGLVVSVWGLVQLTIMGLAFKGRAVAFVEDIKFPQEVR
jgi:hypothetical protein